MTEKGKRETVRNDDVEGAVVFNVFVLMLGFVAGHFFSCFFGDLMSLFSGTVLRLTELVATAFFLLTGKLFLETVSFLFAPWFTSKDLLVLCCWMLSETSSALASSVTAESCETSSFIISDMIFESTGVESELWTSSSSSSLSVLRHRLYLFLIVIVSLCVPCRLFLCVPSHLFLVVV
ncbi:hypothetical protein F2Q69_00054713 [Brassica cretica]|uniref:Transmembrane protein n=1 Tax=Brassica cretica TaxID=69181 RepID=A0A8S9N4B5_BRACR|nr:hypothetical protein F2Q69_00054713 [Brassica cretica]